MKWRPTKVGDTRTVQRFAWFPTELSDGNRLWLEHFTSEEEYSRFYPCDTGWTWTWRYQ